MVVEKMKSKSSVASFFFGFVECAEVAMNCSTLLSSLADFCVLHAGEKRTLTQKAMWWMISAANAKAKKKYETLTRRTFLLHQNFQGTRFTRP